MFKLRKAELYLLMVTAIWGLTFPLIGTAVKNINPVEFVFIRFCLAAIIMLPVVWRDLKYTDRKTLKYAFLLGMLNLGAYSFQSIGLTSITPSESAFITAVSVILVPFLLPFFKVQRIRILDFISSGICLLGLYILTGTHIINLNKGELTTLLCAICVAFTVIVIQIAGNKIPKLSLLVFYQIIFTAGGALPFILHQGIHISLNNQVIFSIVFCGIFATVLVFYAQIKFQKYVTATKAALIYSAEPLFACVFAWIINGDKITFSIVLGGSIIFFSMILPDIAKIKFTKNLPIES